MKQIRVNVADTKLSLFLKQDNKRMYAETEPFFQLIKALWGREIKVVNVKVEFQFERIASVYVRDLK